MACNNTITYEYDNARRSTGAGGQGESAEPGSINNKRQDVVFILFILYCVRRALCGYNLLQAVGCGRAEREGRGRKPAGNMQGHAKGDFCRSLVIKE